MEKTVLHHGKRQLGPSFVASCSDPIHHRVTGPVQFYSSVLAARSFSQETNAATVFHQRDNHGRQNRRQQNPRKKNPNSPERSVRSTTKRIVQLGADAQNSATNASQNLQASVVDKSFWKEADSALKWWVKQGTAESVELSFQLLDALADLSMIAQQPISSSTILNAKTLNQLVQNWLVAWARDEKTTLPPTSMFSKLEGFRISSRTTSRTRLRLRPNLETYQLLMEATSLRSSTQTPVGYNEFIVRHLLEEGKETPDIRPDVKTIAHILHGWSSRGQAVPLEELKGVLMLLQDFCESEDNSMISTKSNNKDYTPVELFNKALFAFARGNSKSKDSRGAEKMLLILKFMEFMASGYNKKDGIDLYPSVDSYNLVLNAFARVGKGAQAEVILRNWVDRYVQAVQDDNSVNGKVAKPVSKSFTIVMNAFGNSEENYAAEKSEGILRWQKELNNDGVLQGYVPLETITYNNVIRAWSWRRSDKGVGRCDRLRKEMIQSNVTPNLQTYGQSLKGIALSNLPEKGRRAVQVWREMQFRGIEADDYARSYFEKCVASTPSRRPRNRKHF